MKKSIIKKLSGFFGMVMAAVLSVSILASCDPPSEAELESISIMTPPAKTEYVVGEKFSPTGMVIMANYTDETSEVVTSYTYSPEGALTLTDTSVTISYTEGDITKTTTQAITVAEPAVLESIAITTSPTKTEYVIGETFSKTGMVVTAYYDNDTSRVVTDYTWSPTEALTYEDEVITISYEEGGVTKTATQAISVVDVQVKSVSITKAPEKMSYNLGDTFDPTGLEAKITYTNGATKEVDLTDPNLTVEPTVIDSVNDTVVKASYEEDGVKATGCLSTKIVINAREVTESDYTGAEELFFSKTENYVAEGSKITVGTWSSDGNTFDRLRADSADSKITFSHDYSDITDKSKAGLRVIMCDTRGGAVIRISTDNQETWTTIAEAGENTNMIPADYKYPSSTIDGKPAADRPNRNVYYCYYDLGKYMDEDTGMVYIQFSYEDPSEKGWIGDNPDLGADLMHSIVFYDSIEIGKLSGTVKVDALTVKTPPVKTTYLEEEQFDPTGVVLEATWTDGSKTEITSGYTFAPNGSLTVDDTAITFSYGGQEAVLPITVQARVASLDRIAVTAAPAKTVYYEGDTFEPAGMVVTAYYSDGSSADITGYTLSVDGALTADVESVTISYNGKETSQPIRVLRKALIESDYDIADELLFTDENNYELCEGAYTNPSQTRYFTDEEGTEAVRLRANSPVGAYIQVAYTFDEDVDLNEAGFMFYCIQMRLYTTVSISTDGEHYTTILQAQEGDATISGHADWHETANNIVSTKGGTDTDKDGNLVRLYFNIGEYLNGSRTVYLRFGCEKPDFEVPDGKREGADIFGSVTFYSRLDLSKVVA